MSLLESSVRMGDMDVNHQTHSRNRSTSSGTFAYEAQNQGYTGQAYGGYHSRNAPSIITFSSGGSTTAPPQFSNYRPAPISDDLRRSTSSRSGGSVITTPTSYVALLRKQKATVWCDRPQVNEDPNMHNRRIYARLRAQQELCDGLGGAVGYSSAAVGSGGRASTGLSGTKMGGKIRHSKTTPFDYVPGENHVGAGGVPMRLSATEVEGEDSGDEDSSGKLHHRRTGSSGRSSIGSARRGAAYRSGGPGGSQSSRRRSPTDTPEKADSLAEERPEDLEEDPEGDGRANSFKSGDSAEMMDNVGELGTASRLASKSHMHAAMARDKSVKNVEDLQRRGSVDERTMSITAGRLYIANPD